MYFCEAKGTWWPTRNEQTGISMWSETLWLMFISLSELWTSASSTSKRLLVRPSTHPNPTLNLHPIKSLRRSYFLLTICWSQTGDLEGR